ncbi:hypothetical protein L5515_018806 [Caenorhabditis briggsae]|uniref:Smr domain-containing protein n=1 Tax=Caenorhabditis briggsae TaxID=6238 RepID=A0AAE9FCC3_CAEBR|nr:hypothetical protein L5515_018806 [Caenorhabditis briggsae]
MNVFYKTGPSTLQQSSSNAGQSNAPRLDWNHQKDEKSCAEHGFVQDHAQDSQPNFHMSLAEVWQNVTQHERKIWSERCARVKKLEKEQFEKGWILAQTVHKQQRKSDVSDMKEKKALEDQINQLEERKNVPLNVFFTLLPHLWVIDLHGFLIGGAVRYVNKIAEEMMEMSETKEVILITGYANSRCDKDPLIKINLLQKFPQNVREDPNNGGRLIFPAKFKFSNGYVT